MGATPLRHQVRADDACVAGTSRWHAWADWLGLQAVAASMVLLCTHAACVPCMLLFAPFPAPLASFLHHRHPHARAARSEGKASLGTCVLQLSLFSICKVGHLLPVHSKSYLSFHTSSWRRTGGSSSSRNSAARRNAAATLCVLCLRVCQPAGNDSVV